MINRPAKSIKEFQLGKRWGKSRQSLLAPLYAAHLEKPLGYWAADSDRHLPLSLLDRNVGELLALQYEEVRALPGIGIVKFESLLQLLQRAMDDRRQGEAPSNAAQPEGAPRNGEFDPRQVTEHDWSRWRETVQRQKLAALPLGRLLPSLGDIPSVLWQTPLSEFLNVTLIELRNRRNFGEKRISGILRVFHDLHVLLGQTPVERWVLRLVPCFAAQIEDWIQQVIDCGGSAAEEEIDRKFTRPILAQLDRDLGPQHTKLVRARLGANMRRKSVQELAQREEMTRARIYQMFDECAAMFRVRWPSGRHWLSYGSRITVVSTSESEPRIIQYTADLLFPEVEQREQAM